MVKIRVRVRDIAKKTEKVGAHPTLGKGRVMAAAVEGTLFDGTFPLHAQAQKSRPYLPRVPYDQGRGCVFRPSRGPI